jgi:hypothetical protein
MHMGMKMEMSWYKHRWPWLLMAGPVLAIVGGSYTSWLAFSHQDALVVGDYYKKGKAINQDLRRDRAATALGLAVTLRYDAAEGALRGHLAAAGTSAAALPRQALTIRLSHATQPEHDLVLLARPDENGNFSIALPMLERSRWQVVIEGERRDWRLEGEWLWPTEREVRVNSQQITQPDTRAP